MELRSWHDHDTLHVSVVGPIDDGQAAYFREHLQLLLGLHYSSVVLDFSSVSFICSSAIGRLLLFYRHIKAAGRSMTVRGISDSVWKLFEYTNVNLLFPVERGSGREEYAS